MLCLTLHFGRCIVSTAGNTGDATDTATVDNAAVDTTTQAQVNTAPTSDNPSEAINKAQVASTTPDIEMQAVSDLHSATFMDTRDELPGASGGTKIDVSFIDINPSSK
jgi:hypothetical protein